MGSRDADRPQNARDPQRLVVGRDDASRKSRFGAAPVHEIDTKYAEAGRIDRVVVAGDVVPPAISISAGYHVASRGDAAEYDDEWRIGRPG